jgi:hypothetical protein
VFPGTDIAVRYEVVDGGPTARRHANHPGES